MNSSILSSSLTGWRGLAAFKPVTAQPAQLLELYEYEASPYCRLVREVLTELDLDARILPCPKGGQRFRDRVVQTGGKAQFPFLVDPNADLSLYESADIIRHLRETYGRRNGERRPLRRVIDIGRASLGSLPRARRGLRARPSSLPGEALELYSFESSPFSRLVREVLCELQLPYVLRNMGKARWEDMGPPEMRQKLFPDLAVEGRNRQRLLERTGRVQVPYLIDPNTGTEMFESARIIDYLETTYAG